MKIESIQAVPFRIPLRQRLKWGNTYMDAAEHVLIRIMTDEGIEGIAEAIPRPTIYGETQDSIVKIVRDIIAPALIGEDPFNVDRIHQNMDMVTVWNLAAKGALDIALYDIMGKKCGVPCYKLLGGYKKKIALSWMVSQNNLNVMIGEVERKYAEGVRAFKLKGGKDPDFDIAMCMEMRKRFGKEVTLYLDANMLYDFSSALKVLSALEGVLDYCEEPMPAWDHHGRKKLSQMIKLPLLGDESVFTVKDVVEQLELGAIGMLMLKMPRNGFTIAKKIVALCEARNIPMLTGTQSETSLGAAACAHLACACRQISYPCENNYYQEYTDSLLKKDPVIDDGWMLVPEAPGLGVELDEDKLAHYANAL